MHALTDGYKNALMMSQGVFVRNQLILGYQLNLITVNKND